MKKIKYLSVSIIFMLLNNVVLSNPNVDNANNTINNVHENISDIAMDWEILNIEKIIPYKLNEILNEYFMNMKNEDVYYNDLTPLSVHIYSYVKELIDNGIKIKEIENVWKGVLQNKQEEILKNNKKNKQIINSNQLTLYNIGSIKDLMNHWVHIKRRLFKEEINSILKIDVSNNEEIQSIKETVENDIYSENKTIEIENGIKELNTNKLFGIEKKYNDLLKQLQIIPQYFMPNDANIIVRYILEQFNFTKQDIIQHISNIIYSGIFEIQLPQSQIPVLIENINRTMDGSQTLNIRKIIKTLQNEYNKIKNNGIQIHDKDNNLDLGNSTINSNFFGIMPQKINSRTLPKKNKKYKTVTVNQYLQNNK